MHTLQIVVTPAKVAGIMLGVDQIELSRKFKHIKDILDISLFKQCFMTLQELTAGGIYTGQIVAPTKNLQVDEEEIKKEIIRAASIVYGDNLVIVS